MKQSLEPLLREIRNCQVCAAHLAHGPRPVVQISATARLIIIGQAPGSKVHASGVPWDDDSGNRLREWTKIDADAFYDPGRVALIPIGFCYPGAGASADLPPRPECAPLWHERLISCLPTSRLTLLVGMHAQNYYLPDTRKPTMTETVRAFDDHLPAFFPLPHPSWRSRGWMKRNPWFASEVLPVLQKAVRRAIDR